MSDINKIAVKQALILDGMRASTAFQTALLEIISGSVEPRQSIRALIDCHKWLAETIADIKNLKL